MALRRAWLLGLGAALLLQRALAAAPVVADDTEPGIWLEMGLLACARGERDEAERLFRHIERHFAPPPGIVALIEANRRDICPAPFSLRLSLGLGYSSNVTRGPELGTFKLGTTNPIEVELSPQQRARHDSFLEGLFTASTRLSGGRLTLEASSRHHAQLSDFDEDWLGVNYQIEQTLRDDRRLRLNVAVAQLWLGSASYARVVSSEGQLHGGGLFLSLKGQRVDYARYRSFDAQVVQWGLGYTAQGSRWRGQLQFGGFLDEARANRPGGDRAGWYALGHLAYAVADASVLELNLRHEDSETSENFVPGLVDKPRSRRLLRSEVTWSMPTHKGQLWRLSLAHTHSRDSIGFLGYRQNEAILAWSTPLQW